MESNRLSSKHTLLVKQLHVAIYVSRAANVRKEYAQGGEATSVCEWLSSLSGTPCSVLTVSLCNAILVEDTRLAFEAWRFTYPSSRLSQSRLDANAQDMGPAGGRFQQCIWTALCKDVSMQQAPTVLQYLRCDRINELYAAEPVWS